MKASVVSPYVHAEIACEPGEVVAITGPNGAGKTTLLRALAGLLPSTGSVHLHGREVGALPAHERGVGWVPQAPSLFPHLSARDNAAYALRSRGVRRAPARDRAQGWLTRLGVGHLGDSRPRELSGGQAARVVLARALAADPDLLLLDEPLSALDPDTRTDVRRILRESLSGGRAPALVVTHDAADVAGLADRVISLENGRVVSERRVVTLQP